jgi:hypothetical protein
MESTSYADKALLVGLGPRLPEADVEVKIAAQDGADACIAIVRVRGMSRAEALDLEKIAESGTLLLERRMLALCLVHPRMTEADVRQWQERSPAGELENVTDAINALSGGSEDAAKEFYRRFEADPAEEFRVLPGDETRPDKGGD